VKNDGTNFLFYWSWDGDDWILEYSEPHAAWCGNCSHVGIFINAEGSWPVSAAFEWFRVTQP
jgi:hypothetical protein